MLYNFLYLIALTTITVGGDVLLKEATKHTGTKSLMYLCGGILVYILVAFGFFYMYKSIEFSTAGIIYAILTIVLFAGVGLVVFGEKITFGEGIGIILAIISVLLMSRFAN